MILLTHIHLTKNQFIVRQTKDLGREHLSMKIRANYIDRTDAERFDSFSSIIINCKYILLL